LPARAGRGGTRSRLTNFRLMPPGVALSGGSAHFCRIPSDITLSQGSGPADSAPPSV
jgi:hypothetical protein